LPAPAAADLVAALRAEAAALGLRIRIASAAPLPEDAARLAGWLAAGHHGAMDYLARPWPARHDPQGLLPGARAVVMAALDYLPESPAAARAALATPAAAYLARYALGRDYHRVLRGLLKSLGQRLVAWAGGGRTRACVDSAPLLERAFARDAGMGFVGKNTCLIAPRAGSFFFLGALLTDLPLPPDPPPPPRARRVAAPPRPARGCGSCSRCLDACPTGAIVAPHVLDARRCISYLTIEQRGEIPIPLRPLIGNRVFGCDDCQLICPWNRFARLATLPGLAPRPGLLDARLVDLFRWEEAEFLARTEGSALRRAGYEGFLRNLAVGLGNVGLGNGPATAEAQAALVARADHPSALVREHVAWSRARLADGRS
jgi:epoxyqueuosine reductase